MRVGIQSWGTEGDFRPFLALGRALTQRGHEVELIFTAVEGRDLSHLAREAGVRTHFLDQGYYAAHREELAVLARRSQRIGNPARQLELILRDLLDPLAEPMLDEARAMAGRCDVLVGHVLVPPPAVAAEERGRPYVQLALQPLYPSLHYPPAGAPDLGALGNPLLWHIARGVLRSTLMRRTNAMRARCGLAPLPRFDISELGRPRSILLAVSPALFPRPPDWPGHIHISGLLGLDEAAAPWTPSPALRAFLSQGPPVFLSFGSMFSLGDEQALESVRAFTAALTLAGARGVIQAPAGVIARAPRHEDFFYIERAPHGQLFPLCAAIVHHGGAGTTQSAVRAGRGSVVVPHAADQFYWGDLLFARGVASKPLRRTRLSARALARRIREVLDDPGIAARAAALSRALRAEDGGTRAAQLIEQAAGG